MPQINLYDPESDKIYCINVCEADATRASQDMQFATHLLNKHLNSKNKPNLILESDTDLVMTDADSFRWPHEAILLLLDIYKQDENITKGRITHKKFWDMVSHKFIAKGYSISGTQCKSKMAGLKNTYKNIKEYNAKSGNSRRTWQYFDIMDELFNKKPYVNPDLTLDSDNPVVMSEEDVKVQQSLPDAHKLPSKHNKRSAIEGILERNERRKMHEEAIPYEKYNEFFGVERQLECQLRVYHQSWCHFECYP